MPGVPPKPCTTPGCRGSSPVGGRCERCRGRRTRITDTRRGTSAQRGYGAAWRTGARLDYLSRHPVCVLCGQAATVPDHYPLSRRQLVAAGVDEPDADERLRPLCRPCHGSETARNQPGGWNRR